MSAKFSKSYEPTTADGSDSLLSSREWLFQTQEKGISLGLATMHRLLEALGNPGKNLSFLHIAGTNGKGSVAAMTESLLRASGYKTGLYTSPHLVDFEERIQVDGRSVDISLVEEGIGRLQSAVKNWAQLPTFFELTTALAIMVFEQEGCDFVVLETGLGGRLDATNVFPKRACAITPIGLDHQELLGPTLTDIAREKAGIFRPNTPVVSAPQLDEVLTVLRKEAARCHAPWTLITEPLSNEIMLNLAGSHQRWNAAVALALVHQAGIFLTPEAQERGLKTVSWPGRFQSLCLKNRQTLDKEFPVILDGAHNPAAIEQLVQTWKELFPHERPILIFGALADKEWKKMLTLLQPIVSKIFFIALNSPRSLTLEELQAYLPTAIACSSLKKALLMAMDAPPGQPLSLFLEKNPTDPALCLPTGTPILVTGSLFLVGEALALFKGKEYHPGSQ